MNQENEALLSQGVSAVRGGNKREGARILAQVVRVEPQSADAWFWLAAATDQPGEAKACLDRVLKLNPNHPRARQALELINQSGGSMPPTSAFTGEGGPAAFGAPPSSPGRPLSTNELLSAGSGGYQDPYGAPSGPPPSPYGANNFPPPPPFGASNAPTASVPPPPFGAPSGNVDAVPPPPFGAPAWAQEQPGMRPGDPYGSGATATMAGSIPPPPPMGARPGLSFGQLDPAAAAAAQANAIAEQQAGPQIYDPGAEIRRSLLGDPPAPPPGSMPPPNQVVPSAATAKTPRKNNRRLLILGVTVIFLIFVVAGVFAFLKNNSTTTLNPVVSDADITATAAAAATPTVTGGATTSAVTTAAGATTPAVVATTAANANATAAVATTTAAPQTIAPVATPSGPTATSQPATLAPRPTTAGAAQPTPTRGAAASPAVTIVPPSRAPTIASGTQIPPAVQAYVNSGNDLINQMAFVEGQINTLIVARYKKGDFAKGAVISKSYEVSFFTLLMGELASQFRQLNPPPEAQSLNQVGLDYASDIRESAISIDRFFDTGRISYLEDLSNFMAKAAADRTKWFETIKTYPFNVTF